MSSTGEPTGGSEAGVAPWFVNVGMDDPRQVLGFETAHPYNRHWTLCRKHGCLCAGGGDVYTGPFFKLQTGDELFAYQKKAGYVGYGVVHLQPDGGGPVRQARHLVLRSGKTLGDTLAWPGLNPPTQLAEQWEYGFAVEWRKTFPLEEAKKFKPGYRLTACQLHDPETLAFLREQFA